MRKIGQSVEKTYGELLFTVGLILKANKTRSKFYLVFLKFFVKKGVNSVIGNYLGIVVLFSYKY